MYRPPLRTILQLDWRGYLDALQVRLAAWQVHDATWAREPISLDETRDRSWVDALARFRERCFAVPLVDMDEEGRAILVGDYVAPGDDPAAARNTHFFGQIHGAGRPTSAILYAEEWPALVPTLDAARAAARALPRAPGAEAATAPWRDIASLPRFGAATASRLLVAERPDLYVMLNAASRAGLAQITGVELPAQLTGPRVGDHYARMLRAVHAAPWWTEPRPRPLREAFLWDSRAALLDVFAYGVG